MHSTSTNLISWHSCATESPIEPHKVPLNISCAADSWADPRNGLPAKDLGLTLGSCFKIIAYFKDIFLNSFILDLTINNFDTQLYVYLLKHVEFRWPNLQFRSSFLGRMSPAEIPCHRVIKNPI
jgi:hypothetical protein